MRSATFSSVGGAGRRQPRPRRSNVSLCSSARWFCSTRLGFATRSRWRNSTVSAGTTRTGRPQPGISVYRWSARTGSFSTPAWLSPPPPRRRGSVCGEGLPRRVWHRGGVPGVLRRSRLAGAARPRHRAGGAGGGAVVYRDVLLEGRLRAAVVQLNPQLAPEDVSEVVATACRAESADLLAENWRVHGIVTNGVPVDRRTANGESRHDVAQLVDFDHPGRNDFVVVNQISVEQDQKGLLARSCGFGPLRST